MKWAHTSMQSGVSKPFYNRNAPTSAASVLRVRVRRWRHVGGVRVRFVRQALPILLHAAANSVFRLLAQMLANVRGGYLVLLRLRHVIAVNAFHVLLFLSWLFSRDGCRSRYVPYNKYSSTLKKSTPAENLCVNLLPALSCVDVVHLCSRYC